MPFTYTDMISDTLDVSQNTVIPVICSYNTKGECRPICFRYTYLNGDTEKVTIDRIEYSKPNSVFGTIYRCVVTVAGAQRYVSLYFHDKTHTWSLRNT